MMCCSVIWVVSCTGNGDATTAGSEFVDGQPGVLEAPTTSPLPAETGVAGIPGYSMIFDFVLGLLSQSAVLREAVEDTSTLAECMLQQGYAANQLPLVQSSDESTTSMVSPEERIAPMLTYLAELCTGIPSSKWTNQ